MSNASIRIEGMDAVLEVLERFGEKAGNKVLQQATAAGGKAMKPYVQKEAPVGPSGNRYTKRGALRKSVSARQARRNRPATVVSPRPKVAFYRHFVINGTKPHEIEANAMTPTGGHYTRVLHHPGSRANPFVDRGYAAGDEAAMAAIEKVIEAALS